MQLVVLGGVDDREHIAGQTHIHGLDQVEHGGGRHRRVHGVAAFLEDIQTGLGGQRLAGGDHAVAGHHFRPALGHPAFRPVAPHGLAEGRVDGILGAGAGGGGEVGRRCGQGRQAQGRSARRHDQGAAQPGRNMSFHARLLGSQSCAGASVIGDDWLRHRPHPQGRILRGILSGVQQAARHTPRTAVDGGQSQPDQDQPHQRPQGYSFVKKERPQNQGASR